MDRWDRILSEENVLVRLKARRKFDAIRELSAVLEDDNAIGDHKRFLADLIRREKASSTGIGKGVAIPHAHEDSIRRQILALGISPDGIDFSSVDGEPVRIVALLATPKRHQKQHMELLAAVSRLLQDGEVRESLIEASSAAEVVGLFKTGGS
jgi:fructose-specific phosphotransferase system IIA component